MIYATRALMTRQAVGSNETRGHLDNNVCQRAAPNCDRNPLDSMPVSCNDRIYKTACDDTEGSQHDDSIKALS